MKGHSTKKNIGEDFSPLVQINLISLPFLKLAGDVSGGPEDVLNVQEKLL